MADSCCSVIPRSKTDARPSSHLEGSSEKNYVLRRDFLFSAQNGDGTQMDKVLMDVTKRAFVCPSRTYTDFVLQGGIAMTLLYWLCFIALFGGCSEGSGTTFELETDSDSDSGTFDSSKNDDSDSNLNDDSEVESTPNVPRPFGDSGYSFLDDNSNADWGSDGICPALEVFCNDSCLGAIGTMQDNCTLMMFKTDETGPIALNSNAVFYLAALTEVLKTDLNTLETTSILSDIQFPNALAVSDDVVFANSNWPGFEGVVSVGVNGENPTIILDYGDKISAMQRADEILFFEESGYMGGGLQSVPAAGGLPTSAFDAEKDVDMFSVNGAYLYYSISGDLRRAPLSSVNSEEVLCDSSDVENFCVSDKRAYWTYQSSVYVLSFDTMNLIQTELSDIYDIIACNDTYVMYRASGGDTDGTSAIFAFSAETNASTLIGTIEENGFGGAVANAEDLYVAVGNGSTGGVIRLALP
jgi:hypothetical protein